MKDFTPRFDAPLDSTRQRGSRLIKVYSVKLKRRVRMLSRAGFKQWVRLEADPAVQAFCERPCRFGPDSSDRLVDFWVKSAQGPEMLLLEWLGREEIPHELMGVPVRVVVPAELAAADVWITNWSRMLPVLNATRGLLPTALLRSVIKQVRAPVALGWLEHELAFGDPPSTRGAIFEQLRIGAIRAPSLHTQALSLHTLLEPVP